MAYEQKPNTGSLFKNERKESDTHADYRGSALVNGDEYWLDAWINTAKDGSKYMSLKLKRKERLADNAGAAGAATYAATRGHYDDDLDAPF